MLAIFRVFNELCLAFKFKMLFLTKIVQMNFRYFITMYEHLVIRNFILNFHTLMLRYQNYFKHTPKIII